MLHGDIFTMSDAPKTEVMHRSIPVPQDIVGALIGKNGSTIQWIQRNSGCEKVWVDAEPDDREALGHKWCHVRMLGAPNDHYNAVRMIMAAIMRCNKSE